MYDAEGRLSDPHSACRSALASEQITLAMKSSFPAYVLKFYKASASSREAARFCINFILAFWNAYSASSCFKRFGLLNDAASTDVVIYHRMKKTG
jgi:hypothetical protein